MIEGVRGNYVTLFIAFWLAKRTGGSYLCCAQFLCFMSVVLTIADVLETVPAVSVCCSSCYRLLLMQPAQKFITIRNSCQIFLTIYTVVQFTNNYGIKIPWPLSQATKLKTKLRGLSPRAN
jgi:hypothetical protein